MSNYYANKKLKELLGEYKENWDAECRISRDAYIKTLGAGSPVPAEGMIYGEESKARFDEKCRELSGKADVLLNEELTKLKDKKGEAPSTDATNTLMLASTRSELTEEDISDLIHSYGDNYQAYRTIQDIASKSGHRLNDHPLAQKETAIMDLQHNMDKTLSLYNANSGHASDGYLSFVELQIDQVFPNE